MTARREFLLPAASLICALVVHPVSAATSPQAVADSLLAADRAFSAASAKTDLISGLSAQFDEAVIMPLPSGKFAHGKAETITALKGNPDNPTSRAEWTPLRVGVSADGLHGFSLGIMTVHRKEKPALLAKYMTYWIKTPEGWRAAAYKRAPRPDGEAPTAMYAPSLPAALIPPTTDAAELAGHARTLADAEKAFSDEAQLIGTGPAFAKYGRADATNFGGGPGFVFGAEAIGAQVSGPDPLPDGLKSRVSWSADEVIVASSGDLGVSIGVIKPNGAAPEGRPPANPFFTIWRRDSPSQPWKYIAE